MLQNNYERFRSTLAMNLVDVLEPGQLFRVMEAVDRSLQDYEITHKPMDLIQAAGGEDVIKAFIASKAVASLSMGTLKQYRYKLTHFFGAVSKSYADITPNDIRIYLYNFKQERSASDRYMESIRITLNGFFQWLVDNEYLTRNPCAKVEKIKYQPARRESFSTLSLESMRWNCATVREKALVDFLYSTGCRVSECADVLLSDINWEQNSVLIRHGKGDHERTVYFNDEAKVSMKEYLKSRTDSNPALWVSQRAPHQQLQSHAIEDAIRKIGARTGIHAYPHKLRHTFATIGLHNGIPLDKLQALMGHASPRTTLIYADEDKSQIRMEHRKAFS